MLRRIPKVEEHLHRMRSWPSAQPEGRSARTVGSDKSILSTVRSATSLTSTSASSNDLLALYHLLDSVEDDHRVTDYVATWW
mmetsp:Transcript_21753/g.21481  ORF Transcript_21753/g.21481 Transcript_21753/m.21481 type:complete len:82 (+) Transcript_21753:134-379(+)